METRYVIAANVRARLAWMKTPQKAVIDHLGWTQRSLTNKLSGLYPFTVDELGQLADLFGLEDPGPLYRVPQTFERLTLSAGSGSACIRSGAGQRRSLAVAA